MTTVLITRPLEQSRQLAEQLSGIGVNSIIMPLYGFIANLPDIDPSEVFAASTGRKLAVFTSPRAVQFGLEYLSDEIQVDLEYAVVGKATSRELEVAGLTVNWMPDSGFTSEDLLGVEGLGLGDDSGQAQDSNTGTAIVFAAPGGRDVLRSGLESKGWVVKKALVYRRQSLIPSEHSSQAIVNAQGLLSVWTSTSAITGAQKTLPPKVWAKILEAPALVISARIKHHLHQLGVSDVALTDGPGNADLLQSICKFAGIRYS